MRYGLPYKGSKNSIAQKIVGQLPEADVLVDLFAGGGAITHCALMTGKYKRVIMNDLNAEAIQMFQDAVNGKYRKETRWISHDDFFRLKGNEWYVKLCWSFSNDGHSYLYGKHIEPWKKALWYARRLNDCSLLEEMGIHSDGSKADIKAHTAEYREKYIEWYGQNVDASLESLERLQSLEYHAGDYQDVPIPDGAVVYCDIPYKGTWNKYSKQKSFDYERFYEWAAQRDDVFISEYDMPEPFVEIWRVEKAVLCNNDGTHGTKAEKLYTTQATIEKYKHNKLYW